jgi:hypothetical protein
MSILAWIFLGVAILIALWIVIFWLIGRQAYSDGAGRFSAMIPPLDLTPFGTLKWTKFQHWEGRACLPAWAGFRRPSGAYGSLDTRSPSDGSVTIYVTPPSSKGDRNPSDAQRKAFQFQIDHDTEVVNAVLNALLKYYRDLREDWGTDAKDLPDVAEAQEFRRMIGLHQIHVHPYLKEGMAYVGLEFGCHWDPEHGFGVMLHGSRVVDIGSADSSFAWQPDESKNEV